MGHRGKILILGATLVACASSPKGVGEGETAISGQITLEVDPRLGTWDLVPGSKSRFAQLELCEVGTKSQAILERCDYLATDGQGDLPEGARVDLPLELRSIVFEMPTRQSASRPSPRLRLFLDPDALHGTYLRHGWSEDLRLNLPASGVIQPLGDSDNDAIALGAWHLTLLPNDGMPAPCPEGQALLPITPPSPPSDWFLPRLCVTPPGDAEGRRHFVPTDGLSPLEPTP